MNQGKRSLPGIAFIDFLANLLIVYLALFALAFVLIKPKSHTPSIVTLGYYAVVVTWKTGSPDDVDTYVRDPSDNVVWFVVPQIGLMHLEQDDLGTGISNTSQKGKKVYKVKQNQERVILQGVQPGEYIVNVQMYDKRANGPQDVTIKLVRLVGSDQVVTQRVVVLRKSGDRKTAFRFTLNANGHVTNVNHLDKDIVYATGGNDNTSPNITGNNTQPPALVR